MIYTDKTKKAMQLAYKYHSGQTDRGGVPYIFHPIHVAEQMSDEESTIVALLHDTMEDTELTFEQIEADFGGKIAQACLNLTHRQNEPYMDYIKRLSADPLAKKVKIADLRHNLDLSRLKSVSEKDYERRQQYMSALVLLGDMDEDERIRETSFDEIAALWWNNE